MDNAVNEALRALNTANLRRYTDLQCPKARRRRLKAVQRLVRVLLGDPDVVCGTNTKGEVCLSGGACTALSGPLGGHLALTAQEHEALSMLRMACSMHLSQRALLRMPRRCTQRDLRTVRQRIMPYFPQATIVKSTTGRNRAAAHVPLQSIVQNAISMARVIGKPPRRTMTPPEGGAMYSFAREVLIPHLETHLGWKCPVVNVTTFIVVKAGTVDVEKKQCWHRDINLSYVAGPDQHHVICLFPMFSPTPDDGCAGDFVVASHTGLPDPWVVAPMSPLDIGDVWLGNALTVHRGGICPTTNPHRPRVYGFISVGTSRFDYNNTCPVVVPPWAGKAAASPEGSQGPHATCGAVGCEVLLDVSDATTVFCVTCGNVPLCATHALEGQCGACEEGAWNQGETMTQHSGVAWGRCPAPLQFYMPVDGATFFAVHEHLSPSPLRVGVEGHPSYEECPLRQMHANPLPSVGSDGTFLACPPGSLVVSRGLIGGVALASTDTTIGGVLHWFALGHKHHLMDVALAESYGWVKWWPFKTVSRKKKSKPKPKAKSRKGKEKAGEEDEDVEEEEEEKQELWCICNQVFVGSGHGFN